MVGLSPKLSSIGRAGPSLVFSNLGQTVQQVRFYEEAIKAILFASFDRKTALLSITFLAWCMVPHGQMLFWSTDVLHGRLWTVELLWNISVRPLIQTSVLYLEEDRVGKHPLVFHGGKSQASAL
ncbi:uncharacterized protein H6S33_011298 [Morchella sextelata]|uniref:uncharacterized protein n=1 Tax=Morchella sextelata TaxID=1174677 RepID=UPI001D05AC91|nr:uncharacterized protein H6S33_011298 [Morchella sextelata]KAH0610871.1 hypothetical protein H6S33_011298 [Morchella sextelata]